MCEGQVTDLVSVEGKGAEEEECPPPLCPLL